MNETNFARYARLIGLLVRETSGNCECDPEHPEQMVVVCRKTDGYRAKAVTAYDCGEEISIRSQQSHHTEELALEDLYNVVLGLFHAQDQAEEQTPA